MAGKQIHFGMSPLRANDQKCDILSNAYNDRD